MRKESKRTYPSISLVVSTYNNIDALRLVLRSIFRQTVLPQEVVIADDGSIEETRFFIKDISEGSPVPIIHCWQEDKGFRLSTIRNKAIALSAYEYILLIDGDIILHKDFVKDHRNNARQGCFLQGSRVVLHREFTRKILGLSRVSDINCFSKGIKNRHNTIRIPFLSKLFFKSNTLRFNKIKGCNASFWKSDLIVVNGYNEDFFGWGSEDKELAVRLYNKGVKMKWLKFSAICYHLYHPLRVDEELLQKNNLLLEQAFKQGADRCATGIDQYI